METCVMCGESAMVTEILPSYDDDAFGLPVTLKNAVLRHRCAACGMDGVEIPDSEGLSAAIAAARILTPIHLNGAEIRFLRKACGLTGKDFAAALHVDSAALSRWENSTDGTHGTVTDRALRDTVWGLLYRRAPAIQIEPGTFSRMEIVKGTAPRLVFERVRIKDMARNTKQSAWDIYEQAA